MADFLAVVFGVCVAGAFIAWFLGVAEAVGASAFVRWPFLIGPLWIRRTVGGWTRPRPFRTLELGTGAPRLRADMFDADEILFRSDIPMMSSFLGARQTLLPFRGRIVWIDDIARLEVRWPVGMPAFMCCWLLGWTIGSLATLARSHLLQSAAIWGLGAATVLGTFWWSFVVERHRLQAAIDRLAAHFAWPSLVVAEGGREQDQSR